MMDSDLFLSDGVARVYSNSTMQLDNNSLPEIVVGVECAGKSANTNGVLVHFVGTPYDGYCWPPKSRRALEYSGNPPGKNGSSLPAIVVEAKCTSKKIVATGVRVRKPPRSSTQLGDSISPGTGMVVDAGCAGNTTGRITTPTSTDIVAPLLSRPTSRSLKRPRKDTTQLEKGWKASSEYQWFVDMKTQFKLDNIRYFQSRDAICKACKGVQPMQDTMLDTFCTQLVATILDTATAAYCHGDVKGGQEYDGGHLLDTLASAAEYVEGRRSIDEQDAAHMSPEVCRGDSGQMDSSHSDYYGQTSSYHSNLDMLAASATLDVVDCLKCPTALQQLCDIALDDGPLLLPAWSFKRADTEHFPIPVSLISNTLPAPSAAAAASPLPASPSLLPVLISATVATPAVGSGPARYNNKRAAAEFTDSDTIIAAAPKRLCKS
ncbi:hypothetical protein BASA81_006256 [Batrachochytrium salamandrivorans]|nr:hypothetical protein BASA81_006256 [Batrachochytrium salamandrivorans]